MSGVAHVPLKSKPHSKIAKGPQIGIRSPKPPFIKVEDRSHDYRPEYKEFSHFPAINFKSPIGACPFSVPPGTQQQKRAKRRQSVLKKYCECCQVHYSSLDDHVKSAKHLQFAQNDDNYKKLDDYVKSNGLDIASFVSKCRKKYQK